MASKQKRIKAVAAPTRARDESHEIDDDHTPPSFTKILIALDIGESAARAEKIDPEQSVDEFAAYGPDRRQQLRNRIAPAVARASKATGSKYTIEIADTIMPSGRIFTVAVVTKMI